MPLLTLTDAELAYGDLPLLDRASFALEERERVGLIGRNGTGKSSLLGVLAGRLALDDGELRKRDGLKVVLVPQEPAFPVAPPAAAHKLQEFFHRLGVAANLDPARASGGERKRAALAAAFAQEPDVLLLDEPTNHLDIDGILALEGLLARQPAAIFVTHDRAFLDRVATRILELDRGRLLSFPGNYSAYEERKREQLAVESVVHAKFDKFWAQEEAWIRKGVEARRTRNEGRVRRLEQLRIARAERRERLGKVELAVSEGERSGKLVAELEHVTKSYGARRVVDDFSCRVMRGDRVGFIGPNGSGKTTLLKLILGEIQPDAGKLRLGARVVPAYFDQLRAALDEEATLADTISPGSDTIEIEGTRKHVIGYLGDFLFAPERARAPVKSLSGGERNRLLLARLFSRPANVLVLDEPTNDLDIETLELLESLLQDYAGTLLLVSHDRAFLDNVVTQTLAYEGEGKWKEYVGGYSDWERMRRKPVEEMERNEPRPPARPSPNIGRETVSPPPPRPSPKGEGEKRRRKLNYNESRELEALPAKLEILEREQSEIAAKLADPGTYQDRTIDVRA